MKAFIIAFTVDESIWIDKAVKEYGIDHSYLNLSKINSVDTFGKILFIMMSHFILQASTIIFSKTRDQKRKF